MTYPRTMNRLGIDVRASIGAMIVGLLGTLATVGFARIFGDAIARLLG